MAVDLNEILESTNIAESLDEQLLDEIGSTVVEEYLIDEASREGWLAKAEQATKLAIQVKEHKNFPWPNAANIKYPLLTVAALQFSARSYPALLPAPHLVRTKVVGKDPTGEKKRVAARVTSHLNYQLLEEMEEWEDDMDKLLMVIPIVGCMFKKTYYCPIDSRNKSELVFPVDLAIDYYASNIETARRITHIIEMPRNDVVERIRDEIYLDIEDELDNTLAPEAVRENDKRKVHNDSTGNIPPNEPSSKNYPRVLLEQHRYLDLDDDGYEEPYVVTVDQQTRKVLRIVARFDAENIRTGRNDKIVRIKPNCHFTKYGFIPNPDGGIYDLGFGLLQGPLNEIVNTTINQLLDAGTLSTTGAGVISKGLRIKQGVFRFKPGEYKVVNATPDMIRNGIHSLPTPTPSPVLFSLLELVIGASKELSSTTELMLGESPGQNQPATTTMALLEQGQKVFTAIHKRLRKALKSELKKLVRLNRIYLPDEQYFEIIDHVPEQAVTPVPGQQAPMAQGQAPIPGQTGQPGMGPGDMTPPAALAEEDESPMDNIVLRSDYKVDSLHIIPTANPNVVSETQKLVKAQSLMEKAGPLGLNIAEVRRRVLEAEDHPDIEALLQPNPPPPESLDEAEFRHKVEKDMEELEIKQRDSISKAIENMANAMNDEVRSQAQASQAEMQEIRENLRLLHDLVAAESTEVEQEEIDEPTPPTEGAGV